MRSRLLLNIVLALALVVLMLTAIYQPGRQEPPKPRPFANLGSAAVTRIVIERQGQSSIELAKEADHWQLVKPLIIRANETKVRTVLRILEAKSEQPIAANTIDLKEFGLTTPAVTLTFNDTHFALGDVNPVTGKRYILYQDHVYASTDTIYHDLLAEPASFASVSLIPDSREPRAITLLDYALKRDGAKWILTPADSSLTADKVTGIVDAWRHTQAFAVKPSVAGASPEQTTPGKIIIEFADAPTIEFTLRTREPELVLERKDVPLAYHMFPDNAERLLLKRTAATPVPSPAAAGTKAPTAATVPLTQ